MRNKEKGITLIALIITIIVMLILVGVVVTVVIQSNLLGTAKTAGDKYKTAYEDESNMSEVTINGEKYASIEDYLEGKVKLPEGAGKRFSETKEYNDGTKTAWIPAGFTVSGIKSETTIDGGLVIYDIPEGTDVNWDDPESVKPVYNQFVWIPVEVNKETDTETNIANFYRSEWVNNARSGNLTESTEYTEPSVENDTDDKTKIASQIENLTKSIYKYGGFYIGRYEAGSIEERKESTTGVTTLGIKQDMYPYIYVKWGESMSEIGTEGAVALSNSLYNSNNYGATSMLCTGACWDSMLDFIKDEEHNATSSADWGNYSDAEFNITRGKYAKIVSYTLSTFQSLDNEYQKTETAKVLLTTGATDRNSAKNIYDVAGNCQEWTLESYSSNSRVCRGGAYMHTGSYNQNSYYPASDRNDGNPNSSDFSGSFRPIMYVNL